VATPPDRIVNDPTLEGSNFNPFFFDPFRVGAGLRRFPWALPTAIQFNRFAV
jgi:hypothetical protein